jgi:phosphate transport system substrate-binding protein
LALLAAFAVQAPLLAACSPQPLPAPPATPAIVRVAASDLTGPLLFELNREYAGANAEAVVAPRVLPAALLAQALQAGEAELALMVEPPEGLFATPVAYVRLAVVAHPSNPVRELDAAQVRDLFTGRLPEWASVGGAGAVQVVARPKGSDAGSFFERVALAGAAPAGDALAAPSWPAMRELVAAEPGALGYLPLHEVDDSVKILEVPLDLRLLIVAAAVAEPHGPARDFAAWAQSPQGQQVVAREYEPLEP